MVFLRVRGGSRVFYYAIAHWNTAATLTLIESSEVAMTSAMRTLAPLLLSASSTVLSACWTESAPKQTTPAAAPVATADTSKQAPQAVQMVGTADFGQSDDANIYGGLIDQDGNGGFGSGGGAQGGALGAGGSGSRIDGALDGGSTSGGSTSGSTSGGPKTAGEAPYKMHKDPDGSTSNSSGSGGGGTGWGTIGTGRYGTIGHGSGSGGYGVGGGGGGMCGRVSAIPTISIGQPTTSGGDLDKAIIRRYIKRNVQKLTYCYEKELLAKPGISGTVNTKFTIEPSGSVSSSTAKGFGNQNVDTCIAAVLHGIEFPKPKDGKAVDVSYPFTFRPSGG
jgi:hypothetical protein